MPRRPPRRVDRPTAELESLTSQALSVARKAKRHRQNLTNDNFYGNKLATLRADATNCFRDLSSQSAGDTAALAELLQTVFSPTTHPKDRQKAARELIFSVRTTWRGQPPRDTTADDESLFPLTLLVAARRGYLVTIGRQMNACYASGWYDAAAVMMRRLLEIAIIEAFEGKGFAASIKAADGSYLHLSEMISVALNEPRFNLSRHAKTHLPSLRDAGHLSAHGRYFCAQKPDCKRERQS